MILSALKETVSRYFGPLHFSSNSTSGQSSAPQALLRYSDNDTWQFSFSHNAFILSRIIIASNSYRSEHMKPVIPSYIYLSDIIDKRYCIYLLSLLGKIAFKNKYNMILFDSHKRNILENKSKSFCQCVETKFFVSYIPTTEQSLSKSKLVHGMIIMTKYYYISEVVLYQGPIR